MLILERIWGISKYKLDLKSWVKRSIGIGFVAAIVIIVGDYLFYVLGSALSFKEVELPVWWAGMMAAFYAGVFEELMTRFFLMTVVVLILTRISPFSRKTVVWSAIIFMALLFGVLHLPATAELVELTPLVVIRAFLLNGIAGVGFGWLYWKKGLEYSYGSTYICRCFAL